MKTIPRCFIAPKTSFFLFGPRGTGKSTWLKQHFSDALWIDLLEPKTFRSFSARPELLEELVHGSDKEHIIIDEVQKAPKLLSLVHRLIEQNKGWQFILTGSSSRKLKAAGVDLLAGRALVRHLHPFMAAELGQNFELERALEFGMVPLIVASENPLDVLNTYIELYLTEEVRAEGLVRNIGGFARFLEIISFSHGSVLNVANIARECSISRKIVEGYIAILQDLLLAFTVPVFTKRAQRATVSHPKFYYFDSGVLRSLRQQGPLDKPAEVAGLGLEGLVAQHLRAWIDYQQHSYGLYYWRTRHGVEVDFIVYGTNGFWAIEVKHSQNIYPKDLNNLIRFCEDYPEATPLLLYRGRDKLKVKGIVCLSVEQFLLSLQPGQSIFCSKKG